MTLELFNTSVPAGLETGKSGFCTVAMTQGIPRPLADLLESLSAYEHMYAPTAELSANNPVAVSHLRVSVAGRWYTLLSRVCAAGMDYTKRSNRFAHHVVLDGTSDKPAGGPAWLASRPGFLQPAWDGQVRWLEAGRPVPTNGEAVTACPSWRRVAGDPGWAGWLAEMMASDRTTYLVYDSGVDVLPLIAEALSLLPPERRWAVTFSTYYRGGLPQGVTCQVRCVARGTAEAETPPANATLDVGRLVGKPPPQSKWAQAARDGQRLTPADMPPPPPEPPPPEPLLRPVPLVMPPSPVLTPVGAPPAPGMPPPPPFDLTPVPKRSRVGLLVGGGAAALLLCGIAVGVGVYSFANRNLGNNSDNGGLVENTTPKDDTKKEDDKGKQLIDTKPSGKDDKKVAKADDKKKDDKGKKNGTGVQTPPKKKEKFGELELSLYNPEKKKLRYGDPVTFLLKVKGPAESVPLESIDEHLWFTLNGEPLTEGVEVAADGKVTLRTHLLAGNHVLEARFLGNDRFHAAESDEEKFLVERNRLLFSVVTPRVKAEAGETNFEVELTFNRTPRPEAEDWALFHFYRKADGKETPLKVAQDPKQRERFLVKDHLLPGKFRVVAKYLPGKDSRRFEEQADESATDVQVAKTGVVFRFPDSKDDKKPDPNKLHITGKAQFRVKVVGTGERAKAIPKGEVYATFVGEKSYEKRVTPAELKDGVAVLTLDAKELPVTNDLMHKLRLEYKPEPGGWHHPRVENQGYDLKVLEERALYPRFSTSRKRRFPVPKILYEFDNPDGKAVVQLPVKNRYYLRVSTPDKKATDPHHLFSEDVGGNHLIKWRHHSKELEVVTERVVARFAITPPKFQPAFDTVAKWNLSWRLLELESRLHATKLKTQIELTNRFAELCDRATLLQSCVVDVVWLKEDKPQSGDPVVLRFLLSKPPPKIKDPPKSKDPPKPNPLWPWQDPDPKTKGAKQP